MCDHPESKYFYFVPCSGHGQCINSQCVCDVGWTGSADFEIKAGLDCDINVNVILYLGIVSVIIGCVACLIYFRCFLKYLIYHQLDRREFEFIFNFLISNVVSVVGISSVIKPCLLSNTYYNCTDFNATSNGHGLTNIIALSLGVMNTNYCLFMYLLVCLRVLDRFNNVLSIESTQKIQDLVITSELWFSC